MSEDRWLPASWGEPPPIEVVREEIEWEATVEQVQRRMEDAAAFHAERLIEHRSRP